MILVFNCTMFHMIIILLRLLPLLFMRRNLLMWRVVNFLCKQIMKRMLLCAGYIVEFIHGSTLNYYEGGTYACRNCNYIKFPLYVLKILKLCLFYLPMQVDSCSHKLFAHKIPMHRRGLDLNVLVIFFMMLSLCFNSYLLCEHQ